MASAKRREEFVSRVVSPDFHRLVAGRLSSISIARYPRFLLKTAARGQSRC
jgi:hypothetical protein